MANQSETLIAVVCSAVLAGLATGASALAYPGDTVTTGIIDLNNTKTSSDEYMWAMTDNRTGNMGLITGTSNDPDGNPAWLLAGYWKLAYSSNFTGFQGDMSGFNVTDFAASFHMVMLNGSAMHSHELSNFTQTEEATFNSTANATSFVGTSTVTMRDGPVADVGTMITVTDAVILIQLDPTMIDNHFGDSPIYGITATPELLRHYKGMSGTMIQEHSGNMTADLPGSWSKHNSTGANAMMDEIWK
jgi:hypothetical protein